MGSVAQHPDGCLSHPYLCYRIFKRKLIVTKVGYHCHAEKAFRISTITLEEAQALLPELIEHLTPGKELVSTSNACPVATLIGTVSRIPLPVFGHGREKV